MSIGYARSSDSTAFGILKRWVVPRRRCFSPGWPITAPLFCNDVATSRLRHPYGSGIARRCRCGDDHDYTHVLKISGRGVHSPMDSLPEI